MELYGYISGVEGNMYYVSQGKNKKLYLKGETINDLDSQELVWKIYETVNGKYNGTYYVEWNAFIGGSKNIVGKYTYQRQDIQGKPQMHQYIVCYIEERREEGHISISSPFIL